MKPAEAFEDRCAWMREKQQREQAERRSKAAAEAIRRRLTKQRQMWGRFWGAPCKHGHVNAEGKTLRYKRRSICAECLRLRTRASKDRRRDHMRTIRAREKQTRRWLARAV